MDTPSRPIIILLDSSLLGGIETHVLHLAKALKQSGWPAEIWFYRQYPDPHPLEAALKANQLSFHFLQGSFWHLVSELRKSKPQVLHTHGYKAGIMGRLASRFSQTPVISTFHNGDPGEGIVKLYTWLDRITSALSKNIAVSAEIAERFNRPILQINNFIDVPSGQPKNGKAIAFAGRFSHEKGPDQFLQLARQQPGLNFRLYGTGPMEEALAKQTQTLDNTQLMGQVSGMNDEWRHISLLCITSRHEGLPMVALEAMAHGVPVISFHLGALPQLIKQGYNGWIAPLGDIAHMSSFLDLWEKLPEPLQQQTRCHCIQTIRNDYSYQTVLPQVLEVYQQACTEAGQPWPLKSTPASLIAATGD